MMLGIKGLIQQTHLSHRYSSFFGLAVGNFVIALCKIICKEPIGKCSVTIPVSVNFFMPFKVEMNYLLLSFYF